MDVGKMTGAQLDAYAREKGIDLAGAKTKEEKAKAIRKVEGPRRVRVRALGVDVEVDTDVFDDFDLVDDLGALQDGDIFVLPRLLKNLFGEDFPRIRRELADSDGKLTATRAAEFFGEVIKEANAKN